MNGFGDEGGDFAGGGGFDNFFHILSASYAAAGIGHFQRTAIAVGIECVLDARNGGDRGLVRLVRDSK